MYCVKGGRIELLFWKKDPAMLVKTKSSMYSVELPLLSVMQDLKYVCLAVVVLMVSGNVLEAASSSTGIRLVLSRSKIVAPLLYFSNSFATRTL